MPNPTRLLSKGERIGFESEISPIPAVLSNIYHCHSQTRIQLIDQVLKPTNNPLTILLTKMSSLGPSISTALMFQDSMMGDFWELLSRSYNIGVYIFVVMTKRCLRKKVQRKRSRFC